MGRANGLPRACTDVVCDICPRGSSQKLSSPWPDLMRLVVLVIAAAMTSGCIGAPDNDAPPPTQGGPFVHESTERSSAVLVAVPPFCGPLVGSVRHHWNTTHYNPVSILHVSSEWAVTQLYGGLEFDGAKDLTAPGAVNVGVGEDRVETPALLPGPTIVNYANFTLGDAGGYLAIIWFNTTEDVSIRLEAPCVKSLRVLDEQAATGFRMGDMSGGAHATTAAVSASVGDSWESEAPVPTLLVLRYVYSNAGAGTLTIRSDSGTYEESLQGELDVSCMACLSEGRVVVLAPEALTVSVDAVGYGRQMHVWGYGAGIPVTPPGFLVTEIPT